jgi:hypothetical protein
VLVLHCPPASSVGVWSVCLENLCDMSVLHAPVAVVGPHCQCWCMLFSVLSLFQSLQQQQQQQHHHKRPSWQARPRGEVCALWSVVGCKLGVWQLLMNK